MIDEITKERDEMITENDEEMGEEGKLDGKNEFGENNEDVEGKGKKEKENVKQSK